MNIRVLLVFLAAFAAACGSSSTPASPSATSTTTTTTVTPPSTTEEWDGTLPVGGARFYSFSIAQNGTVNITLSAISGQYVPPTVTVSLGIGQPSGTDCTTTSSSDVSAQTTAPQLTGTYGPGVFCVRIADVGNLYSPVNFSVQVAHP